MKIIIIIRRIIYTLLINCLLVNFYLINNHNTFISNASTNKINIKNAEYKIPELSDDFADNKIIVTLTEDYSKVNKRVDINDFKVKKAATSKDVNNINHNDSIKDEIMIKSIEDITYIDNPQNIVNKDEFCQIISIELMNSDKQTVLHMIEELQKLEYVKAAEPVYNVNRVFDAIPNDPYFDQQWPSKKDNWASVRAALDFCDLYNQSSVKVGVFEDGVQKNHPDLNVLYGNVVYSENTEKFHGTYISGIINAISNNSVGIAGISQASIFLLDGSWDNFTKSITWAINNGIKLINASFHYTDAEGEPFESSVSHAQAIRNFSQNGGLFIASAGNDNSNNDNIPYYPGGYGLYSDIDNIICVGAICQNNTKYSASNYGVESVNIYAPGENVLSTFPEDCWGEKVDNYTQVDRGYATASGTSGATALVSGTAALLLSIYPKLSFSQIKNIILDCADNITISAHGVGAHVVKKLNVFKAVKYVVKKYSDSVTLQYNDMIIEKYVNFNSGKFFQKNMMMKINILNSYEYLIEIEANENVNFKLYDENLNELSVSSINNNGQVSFKKYLQIGTYFLRIFYTNNSVGNILATIHGEPHSHTYTSWKYNGHMCHIERCKCGMVGTLTKPHVVRSIDINNNKAKCLECRYLLDLSIDMARVIQSSNPKKMSKNGSFILPSGIIVLVDDDQNEYFNGTLKFYINGSVDI